LDLHAPGHPFLVLTLLVVLAKQVHLVLKAFNVVLFVTVELLNAQIVHFLTHAIPQESALAFHEFELLGDFGMGILLVFESEMVLSFIRLDFVEVGTEFYFVEFYAVDLAGWGFEVGCLFDLLQEGIDRTLIRIQQHLRFHTGTSPRHLNFFSNFYFFNFSQTSLKH
jgi:hypothetical protein